MFFSRPYLAVWITNSSGAYVKTLLAYYGGSHVSDLTSWVSSNPSKDKTDATTGATLSSHAQRTTTWDGTNASKLLQADGNYTVKFEMTENEGTGKNTSVTFNKGTTPVTVTGKNVAGFSGISVQWIPANTALNQLEDAKQYSVYPNPTRSTAYISGYDINKIELYTINGKLLFVSSNQKIDLSGLANGVYLAKLITESGTFMKKIEKL